MQKNFSLLIAAGSQVRLSPLYDLASALPYPEQIDPQKAKLAMKIGTSSRLREIRRSHWESCARDLRMPSKALIERAQEIATLMLHALPTVVTTLHEQGITHPIITQLAGSIETHVQSCIQRLTHP